MGLDFSAGAFETHTNHTRMKPVYDLHFDLLESRWEIYVSLPRLLLAGLGETDRSRFSRLRRPLSGHETSPLDLKCNIFHTTSFDMD